MRLQDGQSQRNDPVSTARLRQKCSARSQLKLTIEEVLETSLPRAYERPLYALSKIDFGTLAAKFKESRHKNPDLEVPKTTIHAMLERLIRLNRTRGDFAESSRNW